MEIIDITWKHLNEDDDASYCPCKSCNFKNNKTSDGKTRDTIEVSCCFVSGTDDNGETCCEFKHWECLSHHLKANPTYCINYNEFMSCCHHATASSFDECFDTIYSLFRPKTTFVVYDIVKQCKYFKNNNVRFLNKYIRSVVADNYYPLPETYTFKKYNNKNGTSVDVVLPFAILLLRLGVDWDVISMFANIDNFKDIGPFITLGL